MHPPLPLRVLVPFFAHALTEIHPYPPIVHQRVVHLQIRLRALLGGRELHKGVVEAVLGVRVPHDVRPDAGVEAGEDELQILVLGDGIELAHEQDVVRCLHVGRGQVAQHLQHDRARSGLLAGDVVLALRGCPAVVVVVVGGGG